MKKKKTYFYYTRLIRSKCNHIKATHTNCPKRKKNIKELLEAHVLKQSKRKKITLEFKLQWDSLDTHLLYMILNGLRTMINFGK